jgi:nucleotide-binding universal stress UspA family protein
MNGGHPVLLCFDGSDGAVAAITAAGGLLGHRAAVVLTVWEPVAMWEPYDPATIISAPLSKLAANALGVDEVSQEIAQEKVDHGVRLAHEAGFTAEGRVLRGKPWRAICDLAQRLTADPIVVGARGLSRVQSVLLGSVSLAVLTHAKRPVLVIPGPDRG